MRFFVLSAAALVALGCQTGPPVDPLAKDRAAARALSRAPASANWAPDASVIIGPAFVEGVLSEAFDTAAKDASSKLKVNVLGQRIQLDPEISLERVRFTGGDAGALKIEGRLNGTLKPGKGGLFGLPMPPLPVDAKVSATLSVSLVPHKKKKNVQQVLLKVAPPGIALSDLRVLNLPAEIGADLVKNVEKILEDEFQLSDREIVVSQFKEERAFKLKGVRLARAGKVARVDLKFAAAGVAPPGALPAPGENFVVVVPRATLKGLARSASLLSGPVDKKYSFETTDVVVDDEALTLELRIFEIAPSPKERRYRVRSKLVIDDGELKLEPEDAEELGAGAFSINPVDIIVRGQVLRILKEALAIGAPVSAEQAMTDERAARIQIERHAVDDDGQLLLYGNVDIIAKKKAKKRKGPSRRGR